MLHVTYSEDGASYWLSESAGLAHVPIAATEARLVTASPLIEPCEPGLFDGYQAAIFPLTLSAFLLSYRYHRREEWTRLDRTTAARLAPFPQRIGAGHRSPKRPTACGLGRVRQCQGV